MGKKKNDIVSVMGYRDNSPFRFSPSLNIQSPEGLIDMTGVSQPIVINDGEMILPPNSGIHQVPTDKNGIVKETPMNQFQDGGGIYTYAGRPNAKYKKDGKKWLINLGADTNNEFIPIKDPTGSRTKVLNSQAKPVRSLAPQQYDFDFSYLNTPSETTNQVAQTYIGGPDLGTVATQNMQRASQDAQMKEAVAQHYAVKNDMDIEEARKLVNKPGKTSTIGALFGMSNDIGKFAWRDYYNEHALASKANAFDPTTGAYGSMKAYDPNDPNHISFGPPANPTFGDYMGRAWDIATNPTDAFMYSIQGDVSDMPWNYNKAKRAGIDLNSTMRGGNLVGDVLESTVNPFTIADDLYQGVSSGDPLAIAETALYATPFTRALARGRKLNKTTKAVPTTPKTTVPTPKTSTIDEEKAELINRFRNKYGPGSTGNKKVPTADEIFDNLFDENTLYEKNYSQLKNFGKPADERILAGRQDLQETQNQIGNMKNVGNRNFGNRASEAVRMQPYKGPDLRNTPMSSSSRFSVKNLPNQVGNWLTGTTQGGIDLITKGRNPLKSFPLTKRAKNKIKAQQDEAFNDALSFTKDWYRHPSAQDFGSNVDRFALRPEVENRMDAILATSNAPTISGKKQNNLVNSLYQTNVLPVLKEKSRLVHPSDNLQFLSPSTQEYLNSKSSKIGGVNMGIDVVTLRGHGPYYGSPSKIAGVAAHEMGHTAQEIKGWNDVITAYDRNFGYFVPNEYTALGERFSKAMVSPTKTKVPGSGHTYQTWKSSPSELHSELTRARYEVAKDLEKKGVTREEAIQMLQNPSDDLMKQLFKKGNLDKHFRKYTSKKEKYELTRMLPAVVGVGGTGTTLSMGLGNNFESGGRMAPRNIPLYYSDPNTPIFRDTPGVPLNIKELGGTMSTDPTTPELTPEAQETLNKYAQVPGVNLPKLTEWLALGKKAPTTTKEAELLAEAVGYPPHMAAGVAGQWVWESGRGKSQLSKNQNNYFGIKAHNEGVRNRMTDAYGLNIGVSDKMLTRENESDIIKDDFMTFDNAIEGFIAHKAFLETNERYAEALQADNTFDFVHGLHKAGYATGPKYTSSVGSVIGSFLDEDQKKLFKNVAPITEKDREASKPTAPKRGKSLAYQQDFNAQQVTDQMKDLQTQGMSMRQFDSETTNPHLDKLNVAMTPPQQAPTFGQGMAFRGYGGNMHGYGANMYNAGSVLQGIGAGLYGLAEGAVDTLSFGLTDNLTDKGFDAAFSNAGDTAKGIRGATNIGGAVAGAVINPASVGTAVSQAGEGAATMLDSTGNEKLSKVGQGLEMASGIAGMAVNPGEAAGGKFAQGLMKFGQNPMAQQAMGIMPFMNGGNMYQSGSGFTTAFGTPGFAIPSGYEEALLEQTGMSLPAGSVLNQSEIDAWNNEGRAIGYSSPVTPTTMTPPSVPASTATASNPAGAPAQAPAPQMGDRYYTLYGNPQMDLGTFRGTENKELQYVDVAGMRNAQKKQTVDDERAANQALIQSMTPEQLAEAKSLGMTPMNYMNSRMYGGNMKRGGGKMFSNGGFGMNTMNSLPVTEFNAGGTHAENKLGGIPQGMGANGQMNFVEEGELKIPDPRDPSGQSKFIVSAQPDMKITKALAEEHGLSKRYVGKSVRAVADKILRKNDVLKRDGSDTIKQNSIDNEIIGFMNAHEVLTAEREAKKQADFEKRMTAMDEEFPDYMQAMYGGKMKAYGGNIHQTNPNMTNAGMGYSGMGLPVTDFSQFYIPDSRLNFLRKTSGITGTENKSEGEIKFDPTLGDVEQKYGQQSWGNYLTQMAPAMYNIGMGLFGKQDDIDFGRLKHRNLERVNADQQLRELGYDFARVSDKVKGSGQAGSYLSNMQGMFNRMNQARAGVNETVRNANTDIANKETQMNLDVDQANLANFAKEQMWKAQSDATRANMIGTGIGQLAENARTQQMDALAADYNSMYSDKFQYNYLKPWQKKPDNVG